MSRSANVQAVVTALTAEGLVVSSRDADDGQSTTIVGIGDGEVYEFFIADDGSKSEARRTDHVSLEDRGERGIFYLGDITVDEVREMVAAKMAMTPIPIIWSAV